MSDTSGITNGTSTSTTTAGGADFDFLQQIFDQAAADQRAITQASVEGNTKIAASKEKPKI